MTDQSAPAAADVLAGQDGGEVGGGQGQVGGVQAHAPKAFEGV